MRTLAAEQARLPEPVRSGVDPDAHARREAIALRDPAFTWPAFEARVRHIFDELQPAWSELDLLQARAYLSDCLFQTWMFWIDAYRRAGLRNVSENARVTGLRLARVVSDHHYDAITVRLRATGLDYTVDANGRTVAGSREEPRDYSEYWTLVRGHSVTGAPHADTRCPRCAGPLSVNMAGNCALRRARVIGRVRLGAFSHRAGRVVRRLRRPPATTDDDGPTTRPASRAARFGYRGRAMSRSLHLMSLIAMTLAALPGCSREGTTPAATNGHPAGPVTLAVVNARVWTGDPATPWAEAIAVGGEEVAAVGTSDEIRRLAGGLVPIDAAGRLVVPGFIDSHVHFVEGGFRLASVQLRDARSRGEFVGRIRAFAATVPAGTWITGGDWDHSLWGGELPSRAWIDAATPDHPVWINRLDGHMALANGAALKAAGVTPATNDVTGGEIVRDSRGEPTGLLKDNAMGLVDRVVPEPSDDMRDRALAAAMQYVAEQGVTSVHHMGSWADLATFARARQANRLRTRIYGVVPLADWERLGDVVASREHGGPDGRGDEWLRIGGLKGFVDGSLGSHTAAFDAPFDDAPADRGLLVNTPEDLYEWISGADRAGLHVMVHAIGDRANGLLLDIYERVARENGARDRRFRVEHAQHLSAADIPRFAKLAVIPSMQPYHAIDDGRWAEQYIGGRIRTTYAFRSLVDAGARLAFGSDWFVAPPTPLEGIYAAVTRRTLDDRHPGGWVPEEKITVEEALRAYTVDAAYASFDEARTGMLAAGYLADFVMLDRNLFEIAPEEIRHARVVMTVVGGRTIVDRTRD